MKRRMMSLFFAVLMIAALVTTMSVTAFAGSTQADLIHSSEVYTIYLRCDPYEAAANIRTQSTTTKVQTACFAHDIMGVMYVNRTDSQMYEAAIRVYPQGAGTFSWAEADYYVGFTKIAYRWVTVS